MLQGVIEHDDLLTQHAPLSKRPRSSCTCPKTLQSFSGIEVDTQNLWLPRGGNETGTLLVSVSRVQAGLTKPAACVWYRTQQMLRKNVQPPALRKTTRPNKEFNWCKAGCYDGRVPCYCTLPCCIVGVFGTGLFDLLIYTHTHTHSYQYMCRYTCVYISKSICTRIPICGCSHLMCLSI